jgi:membrane fusion protein, multidrug efflux system
MMRSIIVISLLLATASLGSGVVLWARAARAQDVAIASARHVQVETALPSRQTLVDTIVALGDVSPAQVVGVSFPRAGQLTALHVVVGDHVTRGTTLARLTLDPLARQAYLQARNTLALSQRELDRLRQLLSLQLATQAQVDAAGKAVLDATSTLKALDEQGGAALASDLKAPFDGVVTAVPAAEGDRIGAGATVMQLSRTDQLRVQIGLEPSDAWRVHPGTSVKVQALIGPGGKADAVDGTVSGLQDMVDARTQLLNAVVQLPRSVVAHWVPGMKVKAELDVGRHDGIVVPRAAVLSDAKGTYVYQVEGGVARRMDVVQTFESRDGLVEIRGLKNLALPVVTAGNYELKDGMAVEEAVR